MSIRRILMCIFVLSGIVAFVACNSDNPAVSTLPPTTETPVVEEILCTLPPEIVYGGSSYHTYYSTATPAPNPELTSHPSATPQSTMDPNATDSQANLIAILSLRTDLAFIESVYDDFDGDGTHECFALVGEKDTVFSQAYLGEIWYVSIFGCSKVKILNRLSKPSVVTVGTDKMVKFYSYFYSETRCCIYSVNDGEVSESALSQKVSDIDINKYGELIVSQSAFDEKTDGTGHTDKDYWMFYEDGLKEYGAITISEDKFREFDQGARILNDIKSAGGNIYNILYRDNGIININYRETIDGTTYNFNATVRADDTRIIEELGLRNKGRYSKAFFENLAIYPKEI